MAAAFIKYNEVWVEVHEEFLELTCNFVSQAFMKSSLDGESDWFIEAFEDFEEASKAFCLGFLVIDFTEYLNNDKQRENKLTSILLEADRIVRSHGKEVSLQKLQQMENEKAYEIAKTKWSVPLKTEDFSNVLQTMIDMLQHKPIESGQ